MHLFTHGPRKTRQWLSWQEVKVPGQVVEAVMLPTMELLVLTFQADCTYAVQLVTPGEPLPVIEMEANIPARFVPWALSYHAAKLIEPAKAFELTLERSRSW